VARVGTAADVIPGLEDEYGESGLAQLTGGGQSGDAGTDDDLRPMKLSPCRF